MSRRELWLYGEEHRRVDVRKLRELIETLAEGDDDRAPRWLRLLDRIDRALAAVEAGTSTPDDTENVRAALDELERTGAPIAGALVATQQQLSLASVDDTDHPAGGARRRGRK